MKSLFFCSREEGSWIDADEKILSHHFKLNRARLSNAYLVKFPHWIKSIWACDIVYMWFASYFAAPLILFARLFRKRLVIVAGGYDVAKADDIRHGTYSRSRLLRTVRSFLLHQADMILNVSDFNRKEAIKNAHIPPDRCRLVYLSLDPLPPPRPWAERKKQVVMMSSPLQIAWRLKGLDHFLALVRSMPDTDFVLLGGLPDSVRELIETQSLPNLRRTGLLPYRSQAFLDLLQSSRVILQLSAYESFGSAVIEGGLSGCEMVVFDRGALPEVLQGEGHVVPYGQLQALAALIQELLLKENSDVEGRSRRLASIYSLENRSDHLVKLLKEL